ncbi:MAG TPA: flagellar protein FliT [Oleiagrimonas sp.]|nr:flagellar protein FliT [Oleiagrimonas sp.]
MLSDKAELMAAYRQLQSCTARMVQLAHEQDWEALIQQEEQYVTAVQHIADLEGEEPLDEVQAREKHDLLEGIMADSQDTHRRLLERREELSRLIAQSRQEQEAERSYASVTDLDEHARRVGERRVP